MTRTAIAYIRRSVSRRSDPGDISREFQTEKVRALANGDGPTLRVIDGDWGKSAAGEKTGARLAFLAILDDIERGAVSTVYAYSADRLARSVQWSARLLDACEQAGTTIVTGEGRFAPGDDMARQMFHFQAMQNEGALRQMTRKAQSTADKRRERGDVLGRKPYGGYPGEDPGHVVAVFIDEGSYLQTARVLNAQHWPTRFGKSWDPTTVRHVVQRVRPDLIPARPRRGAKTRASRILSGLLRCHCGRTLTSAQDRKGHVRYWCAAGHSDPTHPRPYTISEAKVLPWIQAEAARFRVPGDTLELDARNERDRDRLRAAIARLTTAYVNGGIPEPDYLRDLAVMKADLAALEDVPTVVGIPAGIDWSWPPEHVNAVLRTYWSAVVLGPDLRPVRADWRLPAEYLAG